MNTNDFSTASLYFNQMQKQTANTYKETRLNGDLFNRMALGACFSQCAKTDIDIVSMNEMECTYKCVITYKQALPMLKNIEMD